MNENILVAAGRDSLIYAKGVTVSGKNANGSSNRQIKAFETSVEEQTSELNVDATAEAPKSPYKINNSAAIYTVGQFLTFKIEL